MKGRIEIHELQVECIIGIYPFERKQTQSITLNIKADVEFSKAKIEGSRLKSGLDYAELAKFVESKVIAGKYGLLEDLLQELSKMILLEFKEIEELELSVRKPQAIANAKYVQATISSRR